MEEVTHKTHVVERPSECLVGESPVWGQDGVCACLLSLGAHGAVIIPMASRNKFSTQSFPNNSPASSVQILVKFVSETGFIF